MPTGQHGYSREFMGSPWPPMSVPLPVSSPAPAANQLPPTYPAAPGLHSNQQGPSRDPFITPHDPFISPQGPRDPFISPHGAPMPHHQSSTAGRSSSYPTAAVYDQPMGDMGVNTRPQQLTSIPSFQQRSPLTQDRGGMLQQPAPQQPTYWGAPTHQYQPPQPAHQHQAPTRPQPCSIHMELEFPPGMPPPNSAMLRDPAMQAGMQAGAPMQPHAAHPMRQQQAQYSGAPAGCVGVIMPRHYPAIGTHEQGRQPQNMNMSMPQGRVMEPTAGANTGAMPMQQQQQPAVPPGRTKRAGSPMAAADRAHTTALQPVPAAGAMGAAVDAFRCVRKPSMYGIYCNVQYLRQRDHVCACDGCIMHT